MKLADRGIVHLPSGETVPGVVAELTQASVLVWWDEGQAAWFSRDVVDLQGRMKLHGSPAAFAHWFEIAPTDAP